MTACSLKISQNINNVLTKSGHTFQDWGLFQQCLQLSPTFNYNFLKIIFTNGTSTLIKSIGLCLPSECQPSQIILYTNQVFQNMSLNAKVTSINYALKKTQPHFGIVFYIATIITLIALGVMLYSTFMKYWSKETKLSMFSLQESSKYFQTKPNNTNVLNGLKTISMFIIVATHSIRNGSPHSINTQIQENQFNKFYMLLVQGQGPVAVFFYIGGFLVAYLVIKEVLKDDWRLSINILQRALRILPSFIFVILLYSAYYPLLSPNQDWNGNYPPLGSDTDCSHFWKVILFIDNFVPLGGMCYSVGWYLHVDMQLFVISMFILKLYKNKPQVCKILIWVLIVFSIVQLFVYSQLTGYANNVLMKDRTRVGPSWGYQYTKPWKWMGPYLFGIYSGMLYYQYLQQSKRIKKQSQILDKNVDEIERHQTYSKFEIIFKKSKSTRILVELIGFSIILFYTFVQRTRQLGIQWPQVVHSLQQATWYFAYVFGINLLILPSILGFRYSIVTFLLDTTFFNFMSKIAFLTYLTHYNFMKVVESGFSYTYYYSFVSKWMSFIAILMISMLFSILITILIEAPFSVLQKNLISTIKQGQKVKSNEKKQSDIKVQQTQIKRKQKNEMTLKLSDQIDDSSFKGQNYQKIRLEEDNEQAS